MSTWGVYSIQGRLPDGSHTTAKDRRPEAWFVRWRVDGKLLRRTFRERSDVKAFHDKLTKARLHAWAADERGWPIDPETRTSPTNTPATTSAPAPQVLDATFESYVNDVWWPTIRRRLKDKNRIGHRRNADLAIELLRYIDGDPRSTTSTTKAGRSLLRAHLNADDVTRALAARRFINGRTAAVNARRIERALASGQDVVDVHLDPEVAKDTTVRSFFITLSMIIKAGMASHQFLGDPLAGASAFAPKPRPPSMSQRLVPDIDELFDLAEAIATIGPLMSDGRPCGARLFSVVLCGGTVGPRPGEQAAHQPSWIDWIDDAPSEMRFHKTGGAVYSPELTPDERGWREVGLKHRPEGEYRTVPLMSDVEAALREHFERGYHLDDRTWTSPSGTAHLDWGNMTDTYLRPALAMVFAGTKKAALVHASPGMLRKTAITHWMNSGIAVTQAIDWAGHAEDVQRIYYASRSSTDYSREVALMERNMRTQSRRSNG